MVRGVSWPATRIPGTDDLERLRAIGRKQPFQLVLAGKALFRTLHEHLRAVQAEIPPVFLPNYDMRLAKLLVSGVDTHRADPSACDTAGDSARSGGSVLGECAA